MLVLNVFACLFQSDHFYRYLKRRTGKIEESQRERYFDIIQSEQTACVDTQISTKCKEREVKNRGKTTNLANNSTQSWANRQPKVSNWVLSTQCSDHFYADHWLLDFRIIFVCMAYGVCACVCLCLPVFDCLSFLSCFFGCFLLHHRPLANSQANHLCSQFVYCSKQ